MWKHHQISTVESICVPIAATRLPVNRNCHKIPCYSERFTFDARESPHDCPFNAAIYCGPLIKKKQENMKCTSGQHLVKVAALFRFISKKRSWWNLRRVYSGKEKIYHTSSTKNSVRIVKRRQSNIRWVFIFTGMRCSFFINLKLVSGHPRLLQAVKGNKGHYGVASRLKKVVLHATAPQAAFSYIPIDLSRVFDNFYADELPFFFLFLGATTAMIWKCMRFMDT